MANAASLLVAACGESKFETKTSGPSENTPEAQSLQASKANLLSKSDELTKIYYELKKFLINVNDADFSNETLNRYIANGSKQELYKVQLLLTQFIKVGNEALSMQSKINRALVHSDLIAKNVVNAEKLKMNCETQVARWQQQ